MSTDQKIIKNKVGLLSLLCLRAPRPFADSATEVNPALWAEASLCD